MPSDKDQNSFRRGVMSLVLLSLLRNEDMYGYQLVQEISKRSNGRIITQEGSLYPVLYKLQEAGYISDRKILVSKRMSRVYYHLEPLGELYLVKLQHDYNEITKGVYMIMEDCGHES